MADCRSFHQLSRNRSEARLTRGRDSATGRQIRKVQSDVDLTAKLQEICNQRRL